METNYCECCEPAKLSAVKEVFCKAALHDTTYQTNLSARLAKMKIGPMQKIHHVGSTFSKTPPRVNQNSSSRVSKYTSYSTPILSSQQIGSSRSQQMAWHRVNSRNIHALIIGLPTNRSVQVGLNLEAEKTKLSAENVKF